MYICACMDCHPSPEYTPSKLSCKRVDSICCSVILRLHAASRAQDFLNATPTMFPENIWIRRQAREIRGRNNISQVYQIMSWCDGFWLHLESLVEIIGTCFYSDLRRNAILLAGTLGNISCHHRCQNHRLSPRGTNRVRNVQIYCSTVHAGGANLLQNWHMTGQYPKLLQTSHCGSQKLHTFRKGSQGLAGPHWAAWSAFRQTAARGFQRIWIWLGARTKGRCTTRPLPLKGATHRVTGAACRQRGVHFGTAGKGEPGHAEQSISPWLGFHSYQTPWVETEQVSKR